jgi:hypothetical protein
MLNKLQNIYYIHTLTIIYILHNIDYTQGYQTNWRPFYSFHQPFYLVLKHPRLIFGPLEVKNKVQLGSVKICSQFTSPYCELCFAAENAWYTFCKP